MPLARGDIVLVPFPFTDLTAKKVRPAIIVSPDPQGLDVVVAFVSSVTTAPVGPADFALPTAHADFAQTGLKTSSVFRCGKLLTLHRSLILRKLGHASPAIQRELDERLRRAVGVSP